MPQHVLLCHKNTTCPCCFIYPLQFFYVVVIIFAKCLIDLVNVLCALSLTHIHKHSLAPTWFCNENVSAFVYTGLVACAIIFIYCLRTSAESREKVMQIK